ncbi:GNAT family N-acetyltransferase [Longimycelium tulufanense]|uniref:GNAT family N-acetyltransferase n=1 Tax=Longimycelium tulufanense TaxID=907463 RepID=UPI00166A619E|nr:GNAT family N-acetyltransferase [Longimycelium tulufanense]
MDGEQTEDAGNVPPGPPLPVVEHPWSVRRCAANGSDLELVHRWMQHPHIVAYWEQAWPIGRWRSELSCQLSGDHSLPCLAFHHGVPLAYMEIYRVVRDRIAPYYAHQPHDLGVHLAIGEPSRTGRGLGRSLLRVLAEGLLRADLECRRIVAEPDVRNVPSLRAFTAAGFRTVGEITLPDKTAALMIRPRCEEDLP